MSEGEGRSDVFERETLLDASVNFVPVGILLVFLSMFALFDPWGGGGLMSAYMYGLLLVTILFTVHITYEGMKRL